MNNRTDFEGQFMVSDINEILSFNSKLSYMHLVIFVLSTN